MSKPGMNLVEILAELNGCHQAYGLILDMINSGAKRKELRKVVQGLRKNLGDRLFPEGPAGGEKKEE